jgi:hypothetical protein
VLVPCVSAPAAELPVMHLYLGERVEPRSLVIHERTDSFAIRRLNVAGKPCGLASLDDAGNAEMAWA